MKQMPTTRTLAILGGVASIAVMILVVGHPGTITAFNQELSFPATESFPPLGVTADVNARLNVANTKFIAESNVRPCAVVLRIFDRDGNLLAQERKLLRARQAAFIDVAGADVLVGRVGPRTEIWAAVSPDGPNCEINTSFELIEVVSGRTVLALGGPATNQWREADDTLR
jgi:hypothetical protein